MPQRLKKPCPKDQQRKFNSMAIYIGTFGKSETDAYLKTTFKQPSKWPGG
jgi:hypothetical protein